MSPPDKEKVKTAVSETIQQIEDFNQNRENNVGLDFKDKNFWKSKVISGFIILIVTTGTISLLYLITSQFSFQTFGRIKKEESEKELEQLSFQPALFESLIQGKKYSEALVYLYRSSILEFARLGIPVNQNMTNLMLFYKIKLPELKVAFRDIYQTAEKILFDAYQANEEDTRFCQQKFNIIQESK
jgi:hypothetical protein